MPTKPNRSGEQQNYVPSGNGDASGEYADNESGNNIHFKNFKKPENEAASKSKGGKSKFKYRIQKGTFKYNEYWNTWDYMTPKEFERYKTNIVNAEKYGYFGHRKDRLEERDIKIIEQSEALNVSKEAKTLFKDRIKNLTIEELNKMTLDDLYKQEIKNVLGKEFNDEEVKVFIRENRDVLMEGTNEFVKEIQEQRFKVADEYINKNFKKIKGEHSISEDLKSVNPNYSKSRYYQINCQRCSYAYELRRRGYDVEAYPNDDNFGAKKGTFWTKQMKPTETYEFSNNIGARRLHNKISEKVLNAGDGSRFAIEVQWTRSRTGHLFIVENVGGQVKYFDAQTGNENCEDYLNSVATSKTTRMMRMDNAKFDIGVVMTGYSPKEK